jgi:hypothetical protein
VRLKLEAVEGWISVTGEHVPIAGQLKLDLQSLQPDPGPNGESVAIANLGPLVNAGALVLNLQSATGGGSLDDEASLTELTLNNFRSELSPTWKVALESGGHGATASWRKWVELPIADHGLTPRLRTPSGQEMVTTIALMRLSLELLETAPKTGDRAISVRNP